MTLTTGTTLVGKYRLDARISKRDSAEVYRPSHVQLCDARAIRLLRRVTSIASRL